MRKCLFYIITFLIFLLLPNQGFTQKVGLVLSGGGAKGMTHIGVIKALEENAIPIDYVAGTSMGAIIGGLYVMGMTTDEMIELLKSDNFRHWSTGEIEQEYIFYYKNADPNPAFLDLDFRIEKPLKVKPLIPTNFISPVQMNYAFLELFTQATSVSNADFDSLFVPFRCVASDIHKKNAVVFKDGNLGDAVRASMTFPFVYRPLEIDGTLLFDGGIFNNFPVDVMHEDFNPDFIVGSVVASNPEKPGMYDLYQQLQAMIMNHTEYSIPEEEGVLLHFNMKGENIFDFSKVDDFVQMGYDSTMKKIDKIRERIKRNVTEKEVQDKRVLFKCRFPELVFQDIYITGIDTLQESYVRNAFEKKGTKSFTIEDFKESYFQLMSDDKISEIIPHAVYNPQNDNFDLHLKVFIKSHFTAMIGGNISSSTSNQGYVGLKYQNVSEFAQTAYLDVQFGKVYNGFRVGGRLDFPTKQSLYLRTDFIFHRRDYYDGGQFFYDDNIVSSFSQSEMYWKIYLGMPVTMKGRFEVGMGIAHLSDKYYQDKEMQSNLGTDKSAYKLADAFVQLESYALNRVMYPTMGYNMYGSLIGVIGRETFKSENFPNRNKGGIKDKWLQLNTHYEQYFPIIKHFNIGAQIDMVITTRKLSDNYTATILQAPVFDPTPHSKVTFNDAFRANQYIAGGIKPMFLITNSLQLRNETYFFLPYKSITQKANNTAEYSEPFTSFQYLSETSLVFDLFNVASISLFVNYYSTSASKWNFGVNIGCLLFNNRFLK